MLIPFPLPSDTELLVFPSDVEVEIVVPSRLGHL